MNNDGTEEALGSFYPLRAGSSPEENAAMQL